jgi:hypothetical protein
MFNVPRVATEYPAPPSFTAAGGVLFAPTDETFENSDVLLTLHGETTTPRFPMKHFRMLCQSEPGWRRICVTSVAVITMLLPPAFAASWDLQRPGAEPVHVVPAEAGARDAGKSEGRLTVVVTVSSPRYVIVVAVLRSPVSIAKNSTRKVAGPWVERVQSTVVVPAA